MFDYTIYICEMFLYKQNSDMLFWKYQSFKTKSDVFYSEAIMQQSYDELHNKVSDVIENFRSNIKIGFSPTKG